MVRVYICLDEFYSQRCNHSICILWPGAVLLPTIVYLLCLDAKLLRHKKVPSGQVMCIVEAWLL